jgi:hypothetical protein
MQNVSQGSKILFQVLLVISDLNAAASVVILNVELLDMRHARI